MYNYNELYFALGAFVSFLYLTVIFIILVWFRGQSKTMSSAKPKSEAPLSLVRLSDKVKQMSGVLAEVVTTLERFRLDLEDYGAERWNREKESEGKYQKLLSGLFLLLDHLEDATQDEKKSAEIDWIYGGICRTLKNEGIEETPVKRGDEFNGAYHKQVGSRPDELPKGAVLQVIRKGYYIKSKTGEDIVLRPVEVVVSD